jgi:hypothetical protein
MATVEERLSRLEGVYEHLSTRADIEALRGDMMTLRGDFERAIEALRGDIVRAEARMLRWTMGTIIAAAAVFIGIDRFAG